MSMSLDVQSEGENVTSSTQEVLLGPDAFLSSPSTRTLADSSKSADSSFTVITLENTTPKTAHNEYVVHMS